MNKLINGLFIFALVSIMALTGIISWVAYDTYRMTKTISNCPVPVDQIPTDVVPEEQERRVI